MEFDVDVDIHATVRVSAKDEQEAQDMVEEYVHVGAMFEVHSVYPLSAEVV